MKSKAKTEKEIYIKVHESYRKVVAICDSELLGKKFSDEKMQLDVNRDFYNGEKKNFEEIVELVKALDDDNATFNIVGKNSVEACKKANVISDEGIIIVKDIPLAMIF
ncbi:MAG: DUF424 family protein [Nanoarchaeota archaeon]